MSHKLYDSDLQLWIEQTIQQLQNRELSNEIHWCQLNVKPIARLGMNSQSNS
jgi:hypothetical protein